MTLSELSVEYRAHAGMLNQRIGQLQDELGSVCPRCCGRPVSWLC